MSKYRIKKKQRLVLDREDNFILGLEDNDIDHTIWLVNFAHEMLHLGENFEECKKKLVSKYLKSKVKEWHKFD